MSALEETIAHAITLTDLLLIDIDRICAADNQAIRGLAADCLEHRFQLSNKLRFIKQQNEKKDTDDKNTETNR